MSAALAILGSGAGVGKTSLVANIAWALTQEGHVVKPFKAVSIHREDPWGHATAHDTLAATMLAWSTGQDPHRDVSPITVWPTAPGRGCLANRAADEGTVGIAGEDDVDFSKLGEEDFQALRDECAATLARRAAGADLVLIEGAGAIGQVPPGRDLANVLAPQLIGAPVIVVQDGRRPVDLERAQRARAILDENGLRLLGVVVTRTATAEGDHDMVQNAYSAPVLGVFPEIVDAAQWFDSRRRLEHLWEQVRWERLTTPTMAPLMQTLTALCAAEVDRSVGERIGL